MSKGAAQPQEHACAALRMARAELLLYNCSAIRDERSDLCLHKDHDHRLMVKSRYHFFYEICGPEPQTRCVDARVAGKILLLQYILIAQKP